MDVRPQGFCNLTGGPYLYLRCQAPRIGLYLHGEVLGCCLLLRPLDCW